MPKGDAPPDSALALSDASAPAATLLLPPAIPPDPATPLDAVDKLVMSPIVASSSSAPDSATPRPSPSSAPCLMYFLYLEVQQRQQQAAAAHNTIQLRKM
jgi:hypothetical protein